MCSGELVLSVPLPDLAEWLTVEKVPRRSGRDPYGFSCPGTFFRPFDLFFNLHLIGSDRVVFYLNAKGMKIVPGHKNPYGTRHER